MNLDSVLNEKFHLFVDDDFITGPDPTIAESLCRPVFDTNTQLSRAGYTTERRMYTRFGVIIIPNGRGGALDDQLSRLVETRQRSVGLDDSSGDAWHQNTSTSRCGLLLQEGPRSNSQSSFRETYFPPKICHMSTPCHHAHRSTNRMPGQCRHVVKLLQAGLQVRLILERHPS